jgi:transposase
MEVNVMSMYPEKEFEVPELTAEVARGAFPKGNRYMKMRDELGTIYTDEQFADLYPKVGQAAISPWRLALVTMVQFAEDLTDRQAADAVRARIDLKYLLDLELNDAGFDFSVLSEFRTRLLDGQAEERLLEVMLNLFKEQGWLKAKGKQRTDSTHILAAVRNLNRLEIVGETLHHTLNILAQVDPNWLQNQITPEWFKRYGQPFTEYRLPKAKGNRVTLSEVIGKDGYHLLSQIYAEDAPPHLRTIPAVDVLRQVWVQHYYIEGQKVTWRDQKNFPPSGVMIASPYDLESRYSHKRSTEWRGYKVHLTETCETDSPHLITHVETTQAMVQDVTIVDSIHEALAKKELLPSNHLLDGGYVSADTLVTSQQTYEVNLVGPARLDKSWQALNENAFEREQFSVDWENQVVTCPNDKQSRFWKQAQGPRGRATIQVQFDKQVCGACVDCSRCTRSKHNGRQLTFPLQAQHQALMAARQRQETDAFKEEYKARAGVEGSISQAVVSMRMRRTRYRGLAKTHLQHVATAAAINVQRMIDWLWETPHSKTRVGHFARLALVT